MSVLHILVGLFFAIVGLVNFDVTRKTVDRIGAVLFILIGLLLLAEGLGLPVVAWFARLA